MSNQKGFATLTIAVLLLLVVTLTVFMGVRGSTIEQQSANNAYLTEKAFEHAEQGRALFIANLPANPSSTLSAALAAAQGTTNTSGSKYSVAYVISAGGTYATLTSTGTVVGNTSRKVAQRVLFTAGGSGTGALTALGEIVLGGSTQSSSAKAGGTISGKVGGINSFDNPNATQNTNEFKVNDGSGNMRRMTSEEYFMYYFGNFCPTARDLRKAVDCKAEAKARVGADAAGYVCAADCGSRAEDQKITQAYAAGKRYFWLSSGGLDHSVSMGSEEDPVVIFVMNIQSGSKEGKINAGSNIYGVLYVDVVGDTPIQLGDWEAGGTGHLTVQGAVLTSGNFDGTGNASYKQNSNAVTKALAKFGGGGEGFTSTRSAILSVSPNSWSDMN